MTEGRDWTRMQFERCPDCGADAAAIAESDLGAEILREIAAWGRLLASADPFAVRVRPSPEVWSALEYACHVRDLLPVMGDRVRRMQSEESPDLGWWDHEAAADEDRYNEQVPVLVVEAMTANARAFATVLAGVGVEEWDRSARRRAGEHFTIAGISRFVLHEVIHHRDDASHSLKGIAS